MKHVTYYLLVSISFPYIHTRQVGHNEGPQLLVVGKLKWGRRVSGATHGMVATLTLPGGYCGTSYSHFRHNSHVCPLNPRTVQLLVLLAIKLLSVLCEI